MKYKIALSILIALLFLVLGFAAYLYVKLDRPPLGEHVLAEDEAQDVIASVLRLMVLPEGEEPTVATVNNPKLLEDQPFFANAEVGDKVLIYSGNQKAVLYRPSADKIIEVAPINIGLDE